MVSGYRHKQEGVHAMMRIFAMATLAATLGGCSDFNGDSLNSYFGNQSKANCASATAEEIAADEALPRPECKGFQERDKLDAT
jgi:hypothetical protein